MGWQHLIDALRTKGFAASLCVDCLESPPIERPSFQRRGFITKDSFYGARYSSHFAWFFYMYLRL
jgi:hypothetical protein